MHRVVMRQIFGLILCWVLLLSLAEAQGGEWTTETVDTTAKFMALAVDENGNLHASYAKDQGGIMYAFRPAGKKSRWFTMALDRGLSFSRITIDKTGNPHICYTPDKMMYASWDGSKWNIQQIAPQLGVLGYTCNILLDAKGKPHLTWYQERTPDYNNYLHFKYATLQDGVWVSRTLDFEHQTGKWTAMRLDSHGLPRIAYDSYLAGQLKYTVFDGNKWATRAVDARTSTNQPLRGMGNSLVLTPDDRAMISYYEEGGFKFAQETQSGWKVERIDDVGPLTGWVSYRSWIALDASGRPHIVYDDSGALKYVYRDGTEWKMKIVSSSGPEPTRFGSIAIDKEGTVFIAYRDPFDGSFKVAMGYKAAAPRVASPVQTKASSSPNASASSGAVRPDPAAGN